MKKALKFLLLVLVLTTPLWSCSNDDEAEFYTITVASEMRITNIHPRGGLYLAPCKMMKSKDLCHENWFPFPQSIEGFEFVEGYECTLVVRMYIDESVADDNTSFKLDRIISRVKQNSEGLPENKTEDDYL